ncbi:MAG: single-stranded DNA-binding protein [Lachnospiraceae bacterium]|nr:single-stranded DNA-binding protein [Lachnospiraceae bacterium]MDE6252570.1 single-stranded DNA-binding protein [Lachnospiraceae bacterium]
MNNVILMGRPVRDPDIRYSGGESSMAVARFTLAVDRRYKKDTDEQNADFIRCVSFGKTAEIIEKYVSQGKKIVVQGRIQTGSYTNKDGAKIFTTDVVVEYMEFAESKSSEAYRPEPASADGDGFMSIPDGIEDEGLPFT